MEPVGRTGRGIREGEAGMTAKRPTAAATPARQPLGAKAPATVSAAVAGDRSPRDVPSPLGAVPAPVPARAETVATAPVVPPVAAARPVPPRPRPDPRGAAPDPADIPLEEQTPEMRWPPGSWVRVDDVVRHSTGEPIEGIAVGDIGQVTAALSQTLVLIFPTRDHRREVLHIDAIEAVEAPPPPGRGRRR